jgi:hypothetical protein
MSDAAIDACCLIDLLVSDHAEEMLRSYGLTWHLPAAAQAEVKYIRQLDSTRPGQIVPVPVDLSPLIGAGVLNSCQVENKTESDLFVHYATQFRTDGEAMCIALAQSRGWAIATDDRKAINVAKATGLTVICCPEIVKNWADVCQPDQSVVIQSIQNIELFAQFRPNMTMPEYQWWINQVP